MLIIIHNTQLYVYQYKTVFSFYQNVDVLYYFEKHHALSPTRKKKINSSVRHCPPSVFPSRHGHGTWTNVDTRGPSRARFPFEWPADSQSPLSRSPNESRFGRNYARRAREFFRSPVSAVVNETSVEREKKEPLFVFIRTDFRGVITTRESHNAVIYRRERPQPLLPPLTPFPIRPARWTSVLCY